VVNVQRAVGQRVCIHASQTVSTRSGAATK
jgi:hypothetical protein